MDDNEELDPQPPQDIYNVFAAVDLSSRSSSDSDKYKCACLKAKLIRSSISSAGEFPDACSRALSIALNHKEIAPIMDVTSANFPKQYANAITRHDQKKKYFPMQHQSVINEKIRKTELFRIRHCVHCVISVKEIILNKVHEIKDLL